MSILKTLNLFLFGILFLSGCSVVGPNYTPSQENIVLIKKSELKNVQVSTFSSNKSKNKILDDPLSIRGNHVKSNYQNSYAKYLEEALRLELSIARSIKVDSDTIISGILLENAVNARGSRIGQSNVTVRFVVTKSNHILYDKIKSVEHTWPSSFRAVVAFPRAIEEYNTTIQKLLKILYSDQEFIDSLKHQNMIKPLKYQNEIKPIL